MRTFPAMFFCALLIAGHSLGCAKQQTTIPGTRVADTQDNRDIIAALEEYRIAVERKDTAALMLMASEDYWEDGGTPSGSDDYGYEGLLEVLRGRFQKADNIRYSIRYMDIERQCPDDDDDSREGCRAYIDVLLDASYSVADARGLEKRPDKRDQNQFVLEWKNDRWKFLSGM